MQCSACGSKSQANEWGPPCMSLLSISAVAAQVPRGPHPSGNSWENQGLERGPVGYSRDDAGGLWWPDEGENTAVLSRVFIDGDSASEGPQRRRRSSAASGPAGTQGTALGLQQEGLRLQRTGLLRACTVSPIHHPQDVAPPCCLPHPKPTGRAPPDLVSSPLTAGTPCPAQPGSPTLLSPAGSAPTPVLPGRPGDPSPSTGTTVLASATLPGPPHPLRTPSWK